MRPDAHPVDSQQPHPLAARLARALPRGSRVLVVGAGSGRSLPPLRDAGCEIEIADADDQEFRCFCGPYDGILSTHALLHGTCETVASRVAILTAYIREGGRFHATFGSTLDPRCGVGVYLEGDGWSSQDGPEAGVPHAFFHRAALEALLRPFSAGSMEEREVGEIVGRWAHPAHDPARPAFHWFVEAAR